MTQSNVVKDFQKRLAALHLPNTVIVNAAAGGNQQNLVQTVNGLGTALLLSFGLVYLLMIALYNAYRVPLVILFSVPVAAVGAFGCARAHPPEPQPVLADRRHHARRAGQQERDPAGRLRDPQGRSRHRQGHRDPASGARTVPADRDDDDLDDRGDAAAGARARSRLGGETFARHRRHRRAHQLAAAHAGAGAVRLHLARARARPQARPAPSSRTTERRRRSRSSRRADVVDASLRRAADAGHRVPRAGLPGRDRLPAWRWCSSSSRTPTSRRSRCWSAIPARRRPRCATRSCARSKTSWRARPTSTTSRRRSSRDRRRSSRSSSSARTRTTIWCRCKAACRTRSTRCPTTSRRRRSRSTIRAEAVVVSLALRSSALAPGDLSSLTINKIVPQLEQIPGVSFVQENGTVTPSIQVAVDPGKLSSSGFTLTDVVTAITNNNVRAPGGILYSPNRETNLDVRGDIQDVPHGRRSAAGHVRRRGSVQRHRPVGAPARTCCGIGDVANVTDTYETQRVFAYAHGAPCGDARHSEERRHQRGGDVQARAGGAAGAAPHLPRRSVLGARRAVDLHRAAADRRDAHAGRGDRLHRAS